MNSKSVNDDELYDHEGSAALAALGLLRPGEVSELRPAEVRRMEAAVASLVAALAPLEPKPSVRDRLMARVAAFEELKPLADVRRNDGGWVGSGFDGVEVRLLFRDGVSGRSTYLLRIEAGAKLPAHSHGDDEQCMVLEGDIRCGEMAYEAGDFVVMGKSTKHPEVYSENGTVLLLIAGHNDFGV